MQEAEAARKAAEAVAAAEAKRKADEEAARARAAAEAEAKRRADEAAAAAAAAAAVSGGGARSGVDDGLAALSAKVDAIVAECRAKGTTYDDKWAGTAAAIGDDDFFGKWGRIAKMSSKVEVVKGGYSADDMEQGSLGDCYLLSAFSVLAQHPALLDQVLATKTPNPAGVYAVRMWKNGKWEEIIMDDRVPVEAKSYWDEEDEKLYGGDPDATGRTARYYQPLYVRSKTRGECWYVTASAAVGLSLAYWPFPLS